jgi:hypothetical protein
MTMALSIPFYAIRVQVGTPVTVQLVASGKINKYINNYRFIPLLVALLVTMEWEKRQVENRK